MNDSDMKYMLCLDLVKTEPAPVIGAGHPDTRDIRGGFEAGTTVKVTLNGKTEYHMVTSALETIGWSRMRTEHWVSADGTNWARHKVLFYPRHDPATGLWELTGSPFFFFDEAEDRWYIYFNYMALDGVRPWCTPCLLRRSAARNKGLAGINGEFEFPGHIVAPSGIAHPTDKQASSISPPFRAADGNWYAFLGGGPEPFNKTSGNWWVLIVKAESPAGPFVFMPEHAPESFMEPTGFVENPLLTKIKGPVSGREYWTIIFDFLQPEVTTRKNSQIGFSFSEDGLIWPTRNARIIDMEKGIPEGTEVWWRAIRVPHQLIDEGNGVFTCFFSAYDKEGQFESIGKATFRVREVAENDRIHPSMIPAQGETGMSLFTDAHKLQAVHDRGMLQLKSNLKEFAPGMWILVEGGGYGNAWLETQPMGGEMYARHDLQTALNNQVIFLRGQRDDGRLPGMVIPGSRIKEKDWLNKGFPAGYAWKEQHGIVADYEMFQGYCFPEPAWRMYFWAGKNRDYLKQLAAALEKHDAYLWRTRDSNGDGLLEIWCEWDTGEDGSTRLITRGAHHNWPHEQAPGSDAPGLPALQEGHRMPIQSMDVMAYSYSGREVLARIAVELGTGEEKKWRQAAEEVRRRVIEKLWDPEKHACFDRDREGHVLPELVHNNLRCMWYGLFNQEMADAFIRHHLLNPDEFWTPVPLPSIARNESLYFSSPRNNWSGQPQGLTYQRAIHALERYGHHAEVVLLGRKLLPVLHANEKFSQQLDTETGSPSLSNSDGYGPMILAMQEYVARMHGICIDVEKRQLWWTGIEPEEWGDGEKTRGNLTYTQKWDGHVFVMRLQRNGNLTACIDGNDVFKVSTGVRVVTDLEGKVLAVVGVDQHPKDVTLRQKGNLIKATVSPNEVWDLQWKLPVMVSKVPFDYPYQSHAR